MVDKSGLEAWRRFLKAHAAAVGATERELEVAGMVPLVWYDVLVAVSDAPGRRLRLKDLGRDLVLTRSGATRLADKLEAAGLVARQPAPNDRRGTELVLTESGRQALRAAWPVYAKGIRANFLEKLNDEEIAAVARLLGRVAAISEYLLFSSGCELRQPPERDQQRFRRIPATGVGGRKGPSQQEATPCALPQ